MKRSRSMSRITCSNGLPLWWAISSAIRRVVAMISCAWIWMSAGVPRNPAEPWWIMIFAFGSAARLPAAPPQRIMAAADIPIPVQTVRTSGLTNWIRVVDRHARVGRAARRVDVEADVRFGVLRLEEQELCRQQVRDVVVDLGAEEDDALAQKARVDVEGALVAAVGLDDHRDQHAHVSSNPQPCGCASICNRKVARGGGVE